MSGLHSSTTPAQLRAEQHPAPAVQHVGEPAAEAVPQAEGADHLLQAGVDEAVAMPVPDDVEDLQDEFHDFDDLFDQQNDISMITEAQPEEEEEAVALGTPVVPRTELDHALRDPDALDGHGPARRRPDRERQGPYQQGQGQVSEGQYNVVYDAFLTGSARSAKEVYLDN